MYISWELSGTGKLSSGRAAIRKVYLFSSVSPPRTQTRGGGGGGGGGVTTRQMRNYVALRKVCKGSGLPRGLVSCLL